MNIRAGNNGAIAWTTSGDELTNTIISIPLTFEDINDKPKGIKSLTIGSNRLEILVDNNKLDNVTIIDKYFENSNNKLTPTELENIFNTDELPDNLEVNLVVIIQSPHSDFSNSSWKLLFEIEFSNNREIEWEICFDNKKESSKLKAFKLIRVTKRPLTLYNLCFIAFIIAILSLYNLRYYNVLIHKKIFFLNSEFLAAVIGALLTFFGLTILKVKSNFTTKRKLTSLIENPELNIEADTFKDLESKNIFWVFTTATVLISMILLFFLPINISEYQKENFIAIDKVRGKNTTIKKPNVYWHKLKWFGGVTLNFKAKDNKTYEIGTLTTDWMTASLESKQIKVECSVDSSNPLEVKTYTLNLYDLIVNNKKIDNCFGFNIREYLAYKKQDYLPSEKERLDALKLKFKLDETNLSSLRIGRYNVLNSDEIKVEADKLKALIIKGKNRENYVPLFKIKNNKIEEFSEILNKIYNETLIRKDTLLKVFKTYKTEISNRGGLVDNTNKRIIERCILITSILKATQFNLENKNYEKQYFDKSDLDIISEGFKSFYPNTVNGYEGEVAQSILGMLLSIGKYHPETRGYINRCIINKYLNEKLPPKDKPREKANYYNKRLSYILETHTHGLLNDANVGKSEAFITLVKNYIKYHGGYLNSKDTEGFIKLLENKLKQKGHVLKDDLSKYLEDIIINANS